MNQYLLLIFYIITAIYIATVIDIWLNKKYNKKEIGKQKKMGFKQ